MRTDEGITQIPNYEQIPDYEQTPNDEANQGEKRKTIKTQPRLPAQIRESSLQL
jgi:hypothetical protein